MEKIGIIAAIEEEMLAIKDIMKETQKRCIQDITIYEGNIGLNQCALVQCGVGKVNAARATQMLLDQYDMKCIINVGSAGALNEILEIGDIVIGKELVQHDFDSTAFGDPKGYITGVGREIPTDEHLIQKCEDVMEDTLRGNKCIIGTIATGDRFCTEMTLKKEITEEFGADCVEMEGAAIAQVCYLAKVPCVVIRSISDKLNGKNQIDFDKYIERASKHGAEFIEKLLEKAV